MVSCELDFEAAFSAETLTRENVFTLKDQVYSSKDNYEELEKRIKALRSSLTSEENTPDAKKETLILGISLWILGEQEEAIKTLTVLKTNKFACYFLGKCYQEREDYEKALQFFERSQLTDEEDIHIQIDIAETKRLSGDFQEALKLIQKLSKGHDDEANLHFQWAYCLDNLGDYEDALTHYDKALEIDPSHSDSLFRLAYDYDLSGNDEKALEYYKKCIEETPIHSNAMINLGLIYEDNDDYEMAVSCYDAVVKSYPNHEIARLYLRDAKAGINMVYDEDKAKKQDEETEVLNIPISDFELSVRSKNCLERMDILTLDDLTKVTEFELLSYKNFGETSLTEIKNILNQKGLRLGQAVDEHKPSAFFFGADSSGDEGNLSKSISEIELSSDCRNAIKEIGIETISDLVSKSEIELLEQDGFTQAYVDEVIDQLLGLGLKLHSGNNVG
jgi:DNA-directed RNA polymerase subunit alpha